MPHVTGDLMRHVKLSQEQVKRHVMRHVTEYTIYMSTCLKFQVRLLVITALLPNLCRCSVPRIRKWNCRSVFRYLKQLTKSNQYKAFKVLFNFVSTLVEAVPSEVDCTQGAS